MGRSQGATRWRHHSLQRRAARPAGTSIRTHNHGCQGLAARFSPCPAVCSLRETRYPGGRPRHHRRWCLWCRCQLPAPTSWTAPAAPALHKGTHGFPFRQALCCTADGQHKSTARKLDLRLEQSTCTPPPPPPPATGRSPQRVKLACKPAIHAGLMGLGAGASQLAQSTAAKKQEASEQDCFNAAPLKLRTALACSEPPGAQRLVFFVWALRLPRLLSALWAASCVSATN